MLAKRVHSPSLSLRTARRTSTGYTATSCSSSTTLSTIPATLAALALAYALSRMDTSACNIRKNIIVI